MLEAGVRVVAGVGVVGVIVVAGVGISTVVLDEPGADVAGEGRD